MKNYLKRFFIIFIFLLTIFIVPNSVSAITFDLIAPSGQLQRGQDIKFTINVDTEGKSSTSTRIGMTYDTKYLEYISVSAGNTFATISGCSGSGAFAYVTFKLIATAPGSTQLCALFNPAESTPTPIATSPPLPTALPTSGVNGNFVQIAFGLIFLILAGTGLIVFKNL